MDITPQKFIETMNGFTQMMEEEKRERITPEITAKFIIEKSENQPNFIHSEIYLLYEFSYDISNENINKIKSLPRETLIKDLNTVLYDSIARYHIFSENNWDDSHNWFPIHALLIMRDIKAEESLEAILDFLSQDEEFLEYWLSDMLTEHIWSVITMCGINNFDRLQSFMHETGRYTWARTSVAEAVNQLALHEIVSKQKINDWKKVLFQIIKN